MSARRVSTGFVLTLLLGLGLGSSAHGANVASSGFDKRAGDARATVKPAVRAARASLRATLGARAIVNVDRATGRLRVLGRLDGTLTGASSDDAATVARRFLRDNAGAYGLTSAQIDGLKAGPEQRSGRLVSVRLTQSRGGVQAIDSSVRAVTTRDGRLVRLIGAPDPDLDVAATSARISSAQAATIGARASAAPNRAAGAGVSAVIFHIGPTARLGWRVLVAAPRQLHDVLVDATTGAVVRRANRVVAANNAIVYPAWPDAPAGGSPVTVDLAPYLTNPGAPTSLQGPNAHAFTDAPDVVPGFDLPLDTTPAPGSDVPPSAGTDFNYPLSGFTLGSPPCPNAGPSCIWDPLTPFSWQTNREQDATNLFYLVNSFHDYLAAAPIGFNATEGDFEGDDRILAQSMDGADTNLGLPDPFHVDNANMLTLPDGTPASMQMYLFGMASFFGPSPFFAVSSGQDASIVYHEYAHGLRTA